MLEALKRKKLQAFRNSCDVFQSEDHLVEFIDDLVRYQADISNFGIERYSNFAGTNLQGYTKLPNIDKNIYPSFVGKVFFNMIYCPIGEFEIESLDESGQIMNDSLITKRIEQPFLLGETEVTQALYEEVVNENPTCFKPPRRIKKDPNCPIDSMSWYTATIFCNRLSDLHGLDRCYKIDQFGTSDPNVIYLQNKNGYRLPTIAEWEYAAKAGTKNRWPGTSDLHELNRIAWFGEYSGSSSLSGGIHPVKGKKPNEWGFYDMSGNVSEWCNDVVVEYDSTVRYATKGGSWFSSQSNLLSIAHQSRHQASFSTCVTGFRIARSILK